MFGGFCGTGNWGFPGNFGIGGWLGLVFSLVLWVGLIAGLVILVLWAIRRARVSADTGQPSAREILQVQYARGEITREQYERMKQDIG
jgi:putative membrane protein